MKTQNYLKGLFALAALAAASTGISQTYYVDFGDAPGGGDESTGNILNWVGGPNTTHSLIRFDTGASSSISVTTAGFNSYGNVGDGVNPVTGGQALTYLSPSGMNMLGNINGLGGTTSTITFTGLDFTSFTYSLTITGNRNNNGNRTTVFTLSDALAFTNASDGSISSTTLANDTTTIVSGSNNAGLSARFTGLNPGNDNSLVLTIGSTFTEASQRYYVNSMSLTATAIPEPSTYASIFGALALAGSVAMRRRKSA